MRALVENFHKKDWVLACAIVTIVVLLLVVFFRDGGEYRCPEQKKYKHLNPRVVCEVSDEEERDRIVKLETIIQKFVEEQRRSKTIHSASIFFRDLTSLRWFSVNPDENYSPGSTLKLPILIAYLKLSETNSDIMDREFLYENKGENLNDSEYFKPSVQVQPGNRYSARELLKRMMVYSDNEATIPLFNTIGNDYFGKVLRDLGVYFPTAVGAETEFLSAPTYGSIFRGLYNGSYLSRENSEFALRLMEESEFRDGLISGIPSGIPVSHKFGERFTKLSNGEFSRQFHDCGIVYKEDSPYILCVMTKGDNFDKLLNVTKEISKLVYENE